MNITPEPRIGDREREAAATALGEHYAAGRISKEEYDERSAVVWAAKTNAELRPVFADLPAARRQPPSAPVSPPVPQRRTGRPGGWRIPLLPLLVLVIGIALLTELPLWLLLPAAGWLWFAGVRRHRAGHHPGWSGHCR